MCFRRSNIPGHDTTRHSLEGGKGLVVKSKRALGHLNFSRLLLVTCRNNGFVKPRLKRREERSDRVRRWERVFDDQPEVSSLPPSLRVSLLLTSIPCHPIIPRSESQSYVIFQLTLQVMYKHTPSVSFLRKQYRRSIDIDPIQFNPIQPNPTQFNSIGTPHRPTQPQPDPPR